jgi:hypothetical protein
MDGSASLHVTMPFVRHEVDATVSGPVMNLAAGDYTVYFSAMSQTPRAVLVDIGGVQQSVIIGPDWGRRVLTFHVPASSASVRFSVGRETTELWIDSVHVFAGNADVFQRDFQHGTVVVNGTDAPRTFTLPAHTYRRIRGTQDTQVNNGLNADTVMVGPRDALVLQHL